MKMKLRKLIGTSMLGLALFSYGIPTWAGEVSLPQVFVGPVGAGSGAGGSMIGARYSADTLQFIGCQYISGQFITCGARNRTGQSFFCSSTQPHIAAAAKAITDSSRISIFANASGICDQLSVENESSHLK